MNTLLLIIVSVFAFLVLKINVVINYKTLLSLLIMIAIVIILTIYVEKKKKEEENNDEFRS